MNPSPADAAEPVVSIAIQLVDVTAGYRDGADVLTGVSLSLAPGATAVVEGPPGAGKSTLLHVLRAALGVRSGEVRLLGSDVAALPGKVRAGLKQRIGYLAQTPRLLEEASAFDNVAAPLRFAGPPALRADSDVTDLLNYLGLAGCATVSARALSHVQRRLVAVARALVIRPDIVIADEPVAGLGAESGGRVLRLLSEMARQRAAVMIATQSAERFATIPASRWRLDGGRLVAAPA